MEGDKIRRIAGLDTLRFIAAIWVVFGHCGYFPLTEGLDRTNKFALVVQGVYGNLFASVPAVIVFFVISGFCIHYPHRDQLQIQFAPFFTRRYLRIGIPLLVAIPISNLANVNLVLFENSILWSLTAELIYYTIYPLILLLRDRIGWTAVIMISYFAAYAAIATDVAALDYSPFSVKLKWLIALPCWLIGCRLAEIDFDRIVRRVGIREVWSWRLTIWFASWLCSVLRFHSPVGYPWTLNVFAILVFFWLQAEIYYSREHGCSELLEWAGRWSYSLYLTHLISSTFYSMIPTPNLGHNLNWIVRMLFILGFAYLFYMFVERPSHLLARKMAEWCGNGNIKGVVRPSQAST